MPRKVPSSTTKSRSSSKNTSLSRESTPGMATTPATSVHSSTPSKTDSKSHTEEDAPSGLLVTEEMVKEESDLHVSSQQQTLAESSQQVYPSSSLAINLYLR